MFQARGDFNTPSNLAWAFQSGSDLKPKFDKIIRRLSEVTTTLMNLIKLALSQAGLIQFWLSDLLARSAVEGHAKVGEDDDLPQQDTLPLTLHHLQPAFGVLVVGTLLACVVLLCEKLTDLKHSVKIVL